MEYFKIKNNETIGIGKIPVLSFASFSMLVYNMLQNENLHCVNYFAFPANDGLKFICCIADDSSSDIFLFSYELKSGERKELISLNKNVTAFHIFEREIFENHGVNFYGHEWLKPIRFSHDRFNKRISIRDYPFFSIEGPEVHEVGVGPVHAGVIEPGHFRFMCHGEKVLHLEVQLGYQHRGIESLFLKKKRSMERMVLAESIAGDTVVGHSLSYVNAEESLRGIRISQRLEIERAIALELERIAIHVGDLSALCTDVAYQLGSAVFGSLRTPVINFFQRWCGNRFAKGLIRVGYGPWGLNEKVIEELKKILSDFKQRYEEMADLTFILPSLLTRFQNTGVITRSQALKIGAVGMAARASGLLRDIRKSHPSGIYSSLPYESAIIDSGDVWARGKLRDIEIRKSISYIKALLERLQNLEEERVPARLAVLPSLKPNSLCVTLTEGWRGEICHCAVTNEYGEIISYKIKDPSFHNWMALAIAVRNNEISDFPVCNKSFNLSYCGNDL